MVNLQNIAPQGAHQVCLLLGFPTLCGHRNTQSAGIEVPWPRPLAAMERQVAELQVLVAVANGDTALSAPVTEPAG